MHSRQLYKAILEMAKADKEIIKHDFRANRAAFFNLEKKLAAITSAIEALERLMDEEFPRSSRTQ